MHFPSTSVFDVSVFVLFTWESGNVYLSTLSKSYSEIYFSILKDYST